MWGMVIYKKEEQSKLRIQGEISDMEAKRFFDRKSEFCKRNDTYVKIFVAEHGYVIFKKLHDNR